MNGPLVFVVYSSLDGGTNKTRKDKEHINNFYLYIF